MFSKYKEPLWALAFVLIVALFSFYVYLDMNGGATPYSPRRFRREIDDLKERMERLEKR